MKGIVNTVEAAVGTVILIVLVTIAFGSQLSNEDSSAYGNVQNQLDRLQQTGKLEEYTAERNISALQSEIDALPLQGNISIVYENTTRGSSTQNSFSDSFHYSDSQQNPTLFLWTDGGDISVELNGNEVYNGSNRFTLVELDSEIQTGSNTLDFSNPANQRIGYMVTRRNTTGTQAPEEVDVDIARREVVVSDSGNLAEVVVYLW